MRAMPRVVASHSMSWYHSRSKTDPCSPSAAPMYDHGEGIDMRTRSPSVAAQSPPSWSVPRALMPKLPRLMRSRSRPSRP